MKTYEEALKSVCLTKAGDPEYGKKILDRQLRGAEIIVEVCTYPGTLLLVQGLINRMREDGELGEELVICVSNAVAQGVLIGMEMEKAG